MLNLHLINHRCAYAVPTAEAPAVFIYILDFKSYFIILYSVHLAKRHHGACLAKCEATDWIELNLNCLIVVTCHH